MAGGCRRPAPPGAGSRPGSGRAPTGSAGAGVVVAYVAWRLPAGAGDRRGVAALGPPLAGWEHAIGLVVKGQYVPDAQVGTRRPTLLGWTGLLLGLYGLVLSGLLLDRFLSSMRALAPTVLAAGLAMAAAATTPAVASQDTKAPVPHPDRSGWVAGTPRHGD